MTKLSHTLIFIPIVCGLTLAVYVNTLSPTALFGDGGEFQFVPWLPGIAHPTGYPLYTLLGWLFSHVMTVGEVAWRMNFFSALLGSLTVGIVYLLSHRLTACLSPHSPALTHRVIAAAVALTFAFSPTFWSQALIAEVYTLHALFVSLVLWAGLHWGQTQPFGVGSEGERDHTVGIWPLALIFGLSLSHHRTMIFMGPSIIGYLWWQGARLKGFRQGLKLGLLVISPNLLYLYLPLIAPHVPYTQLSLSPTQSLVLYENTLPGFFNHILGTVFQESLRPTAFSLERLSLSLDLMRQQFGWGGLLGLVGLIRLWRDKAMFILTLGSFVSLAVFNLIYFIGDVHVLFIPCWLIFSLWIGVGWLYGLEMLGHWRLSWCPSLGAPFLLILPIMGFITQYPQVNQSQNTLAQAVWLQILDQDMAPQAILISNDRNDMMPLWYYQLVENRRPDILGLFPLITAEPAFKTVGGVIDQAFQANRPVYLVKPMPGLAIKADLTPLPPTALTQLYRATPPKPQPDQPLALIYGDILTLIGFDQSLSADELTVTLYWQPIQRPPKNYTSHIHLVSPGGERIAQSDHQPGGEIYPSQFWQPLEILHDTHILPLPSNLSQAEYRLIVGLYHQLKPGQIENLGGGQVLAQFHLPPYLP